MLDQKFELKDVNGSKDLLETINEEWSVEGKNALEKSKLSLFVSIGSYPTRLAFKKEYKEDQFYTVYAFEGHINGYEVNGCKVIYYKDYGIFTFPTSEEKYKLKIKFNPSE